MREAPGAAADDAGMTTRRCADGGWRSAQRTKVMVGYEPPHVMYVGGEASARAVADLTGRLMAHPAPRHRRPTAVVCDVCRG